MDILVVDDDVETLELIRTFLENHGHSVTVGKTAQEGLAALAQKQPHLMLLDIRLPDQDGLAVLKTVKEKYPAVAVVMMTGFRDAELVVDAFRCGAMDCLLKPFNFDYLRLHILTRIHV